MWIAGISRDVSGTKPAARDFHSRPRCTAVAREPEETRRNRARVYRERAAVARAKADEMSTEHRATMLEIAANWERMAELEDQLKRPP